MPRVKLFDQQVVLEKAMELFWKKGYHSTSIQDLVNHLGINRASIYDTYGGKNELFLKSFQHYRSINIQRVSDFFESEKNVKQGFRKFFKLAVNQSLQDKNRKGCFVVNTITELIPGDDHIMKILQENEKTFEKMFYNLLKKGAANGEIPKGKDLKSIAHLIFTLYNGIKVVTKVSTNSVKTMKSVDVVLSLLDE